MRKPVPPPEELQKLPPDGGPEFNRLVFEKSPYLLQHAANPIDWYPWSEEAFDKARREEKPVFLSVGYSTCHWCHVMERESFEDDEVADYMNRHFVSIKVDREEREDIDKTYMSVCTAMTGSGGWPLTVVMTPDKKPFFSGTYFPKTGRFGRPGLLDLLRRIVELWQGERARILQSADQIVEAMASEEESTERPTLSRELIQTAVDQFRSRFDRTYGGFGNAPKFPSPHQYSFLLRAGGEDMVTQSLKAMRLGGIFDHIGFGFHRYSTDRMWLLPHFEKMLYDQAMLSMAYTEAFLAAKDAAHARVVREILAYVQRDMTSPDGGFYSAEDADSEGEEGKFYVWTRREFASILGKEDGEHLARVFGFEDGGNFEDQATGERPGTNIPHLSEPLDDPRWEPCRRKLFEVRERRIHPHKDDKILCAWNGLMIAAFAKAAAALDEPRYAEAGARAAEFALSTLRRGDGRLLRRHRQGEAAIPGFLDDYAFLVWGLIELYQATFDRRHLERALELTDRMTDLFWDEERGGYFFEGHDGEKLFLRNKDIDDGAVPSGNSAAALNLLRLAHLTGDPALHARADRVFETFAPRVAQLPMAYSHFLTALDMALGPSKEIVIAGERGDPAVREFTRAVQSRFLPRAVTLVHVPGEGLERIVPYVQNQGPRNGRPAAYVCENFACRRPTSDLKEFEASL